MKTESKNKYEFLDEIRATIIKMREDAGLDYQDIINPKQNRY